MTFILSSGRRLLIEATPATGLESLSRRAAAPADPLEVLAESLVAAPRAEAESLAGAEASEPAGWFSTPAEPGGLDEHPWDLAHHAMDDLTLVGLEAVPAYIEPDEFQLFPHAGPDDVSAESFSGTGPCVHSGPDNFWPPARYSFGWHLDDWYSGLRSARDRVGEPSGRRVRIAILDTGYDPAHATRPAHLMTRLQRNFVDGNPRDATDPGRFFPQNQPGHGTATMALLAGKRVRQPLHGFDDVLGGAPEAEVVPVRIADSVVHFRTQAMARGIAYAIQAQCDVVSISMGGVPARSWATAVNQAYEAGIAIFAAAGNRIGPSPPASIVYPARFNRVVAVCGATADKSPYYRPGFHRKMQGCFGPPSKMPTAIAAYTPNMPWAMMGCSNLITDDGGGTSSATPQAAAAAALWLQQAKVPRQASPWQKVEAVRHALFDSADSDRPDSSTYFGQGLLRARAALDVPFRTGLPITPGDSVSFPWLRSAGVLESGESPSGHELMYEVEALQVFMQSPDLQQLAGEADPASDELDRPSRKRLIGAMRKSPLVSRALRAHLGRLSRRL